MNTAFVLPGVAAAPGCRPERLLTIREAAEVLTVQYWQLQRAVKRGAVASYSPFNSRKFVKLSEVTAFIEASKLGGVA